MKGFFDQYELLSNRLYEEKIIIPNILTNTRYRFNRSYVSSPTITPSLSPSTLIVKVKRPPNRCQSRTENGDIAIDSQTAPLANKPDNTEQQWKPTPDSKQILKAQMDNSNLGKVGNMNLGNKKLLFQAPDKLVMAHKNQMMNRPLPVPRPSISDRDKSTLGMKTIRLSGSTLDTLSTPAMVPVGLARNNRDRENSFTKCPTPPLSRNHASIHTLKLNSKSQIPPRKPRLVKTVTPSPAPINSVKLLPKTRSQSVQPLASIQRKTSERLHCECDSCEVIRHEKLYVSREKLPKSSEKFADPLEDTTEAFINRIKVLKQYDLETARQEQTEVKRKKKKKQ